MSCTGLDSPPRWRTSVHFERQIMFATQPEEPPCASFLNLLGQIEKSTSDQPEFWNKWHFSWLNGSEAVNVMRLLVYTVNTNKLPTWHFVSQFSPLYVNEVRSWRLAGCDISAAACAWGKLSDHSAYLSPVLLINTSTTWVIIHKVYRGSSGQKSLLLVQRRGLDLFTVYQVSSQ